MAAAFNPNELKNLLECGICLNRFQDPRVLPCLHSYCLECLESHILSSKDEDRAFNCPQCRERCLLPDGGVDKFPKNFFVNTMKDVLPESILHESTEAGEPSGPIMCKHHDKESEDEHGEAVTFCAQCDAHFCQLCTKNHGMFIKDHKVTPVGDTCGTATEPIANCNLHHNFPVNWYCNSCSLPGCPQCMLEKHTGHDSESLSARDTVLKQDMLELSKMAVKRIEYLQMISTEVKANYLTMNDELDAVSKDISDTADGLCKLIRHHESYLQDQVKQTKEDGKQHLGEAEEELQKAKHHLSCLKSHAESVQQAPSEQALCTVLQASNTKHQYLYQQDKPVPSARWSLTKELSQPTVSNFVGNIECKLSAEFTRVFQIENTSLGDPLSVTELKYNGEHCVCSVAPIYKSKICVAHYYQKEIWVYSENEKLVKILDFPGIKRITGMVAINEGTGKLAVVDGKEPKVHLLTLSQDLAVQQHLTKDISIKPFNININYKRELVLSTQEEGRVVVVDPNGSMISDIPLLPPIESSCIFATQQTRAGFVICDTGNEKVYFTDKKARILSTFTDCVPFHVFRTTWAHVVVVDGSGNVKVFSEDGEFLGFFGDIRDPCFATVNEAEELLYVCCGYTGEQEMRTYRFYPSDLPVPPVICKVNEVKATVKLTEH